MSANNTQSSSLPTPSPEQQTHSEQLQALIRAAIAKNGSISFSDYMQMALYESGLGYYAAGLQKFGAQGDFVTAPEISPLFSYALANQCAEILERIPGGSILEFGAGSGIMASDILDWLHRKKQLPQHYYIVELSAELKQRQYETLASKVPHLLSCVQWVTSSENFQFSGITIANEVFDAMPVQCFQITENIIKELKIIATPNGFDWCAEKASDDLIKSVNHIQSELKHILPLNYSSEINPHLKPWFLTLARCLQQGVLLSIDYGYPRKEYYLPERHSGTLMCHYQHRAHSNPLILCGLQDITAYVDFTAVVEAAHEAGFELEGFTTQADFLLGCGMENIFNQATQLADDIICLQAAQQLKTLTLPSEMGERFKVIGLSKNMPQNKQKCLAGFSIADYSNRL